MASYVLTHPSTNGSPTTLTVESGQLLFVLGANGTGKSTLMQAFATQHRGPVRRLTAHRQVWFSSDSIDLTPHGRRQTEAQITNSDQQAQSRWRDDYASQRSQAVVFDLIDSENVEARRIADAARGGDMALVRELARVQSPITTMNEILRIANLAIQVQIRDESRLMACRDGSSEYSIAELSDGERNALLIAANVLTAPKDSLFLIDEPERHLHRAVVSPLLTTLLAHRPDCAFVVSTHDVSLPLDQADCSALLVRKYIHTPQQWTTDFVERVQELDEQVASSILGARRQILFVEGRPSSLDLLLYQILFPRLSIRAVGSCVEVERSVRGLGTADRFHWLCPLGLVDRDNREDAECEALAEHRIAAISQYSVESLYYHPQTIRDVARHVTEDADGAAALALESIVRAAQEHRKRLAARMVERQVHNAVRRMTPEWRAIQEGDSSLQFDGAPLYEAELTALDEKIRENRYEDIVSRYPIRETSAPADVARCLGFATRHSYEQAVRRLLSDSSEAADRMRGLLGPLVDLVAQGVAAT